MYGASRDWLGANVRPRALGTGLFRPLPAGTRLVFQPRPPEPPADPHGFPLSRAEADPTAPFGHDAGSRGKSVTFPQGGKCARPGPRTLVSLHTGAAVTARNRAGGPVTRPTFLAY